MNIRRKTSLEIHFIYRRTPAVYHGLKKIWKIEEINGS